MVKLQYLLLSLGVFLILPFTVYAESSSSNPNSVFKKAVLKEKVEPYYPYTELKNGREGWVVVSYVVDPEGRVIDSVVEDSSGVDSFEKSALKSLQYLVYEPATHNGVALAQSQTKLKIYFRLKNSKKSAGRRFYKEYRKAAALLKAGDLAEAKIQIEKLGDSKRWNLYEDAWFGFISSEYYLKTGEADKAFKYLRRAVAYDGVYLPEPLYIEALKNLYVQEVKSHRFADAFSTAERLQEYKSDSDSAKAVSAAAEKLHAQLDAAEVLSFNGRVEEKVWIHELSRPHFALVTDKGSLTDIDIRCKTHRQMMSMKDSTRFSVPTSWGDCRVYISGDAGSEFRFLEYKK